MRTARTMTIWGVSVLGGCLPPAECLPEKRWGCLPGGGGVPCDIVLVGHVPCDAWWDTPPRWTESQTGVKTLPSRAVTSTITLKIEATTRMHSSRMRTSCLLTVCWSLLPGGVCSWGCGLGGVCSEGGVCSRGMSALGGVCFWGVVWEVWSRGYIPACTEADPPCGQTDACENITLAQLRCGR